MIITRLFQKKRTIKICDKENIGQINDNTIHGLIITPLFRGEELVGVINLFNKIINYENKTQEGVGQIKVDPRGLRLLNTFQKSVITL